MERKRANLRVIATVSEQWWLWAATTKVKKAASARVRVFLPFLDFFYFLYKYVTWSACYLNPKMAHLNWNLIDSDLTLRVVDWLVRVTSPLSQGTNSVRFYGRVGMTQESKCLTTRKHIRIRDLRFKLP